ncbi:cytochrome P450 [Cryomyces antarcticus]
MTSNVFGLFRSLVNDFQYYALVGLVVFLLYAVYQQLLHPLANVPGPFWASISRLWITKHSWDGDMHRTMISLHNKFGKLVRTGPNEVSVSDLTAIKKIYGAGTKFRKSPWYSVWQGHRKFDLFAERDERLHGNQRRLISRAYAMESLKDLEPYVDDSVKHFLGKMDEQQGRSVDMGSWVQLFAFDVIGEVTFSKRFGFMDVGKDDGSFSAIEGALRSASWIGQVPWLYWIHDFFSPVIGSHLGIAARHGSLRSFAMSEVSARKDRGTDRKDILSKLFQAHEDKPAEFDDNAVISMATSNIFAGSDTTAISTRAIIYYLLKNPEHKRRLVSEIDDMRSRGKLSDPVTLDEANNMEYLQAVMYEALRLHPAVGMSLPRVTPEGGVEIDGRFLPAGTVIGVNPWVVHRNKDVFGEDVESFRPDRWLKEDNGDMHRFFFAFGSGARMCLGRNISWMEMSKLIPTMFMHYDLELSDPEAGWTEKCWWFVMQQGIHVTMRPRHVE